MMPDAAVDDTQVRRSEKISAKLGLDVDQLICLTTEPFCLCVHEDCKDTIIDAFAEENIAHHTLASPRAGSLLSHKCRVHKSELIAALNRSGIQELVGISCSL